jgi:exosortase C (VPDSG-CTERM-specific)
VLILCFGKPLFGLVRLTLDDGLYSYILLIPFISLYLAWLRKDELLHDSKPERKLALLPFAAGLSSSLGLLVLHSRWRLAPVDWLAWNLFAFFLLLISACCLCLSRQNLRTLAFPLAFLIFLVPFPVIIRDAIESFLQHRSADAAELLFGLVGTPLLRQGVTLQLPGFSLEVAPECSGIRSTLVLFISSLVAGQLFLRSPLKRAVFTLAVIPLGILRNAFRIVVIGELCVHVDPGFINSPIHHRGGPVFFAISMVPFLLLLYCLRKTDKP